MTTGTFLSHFPFPLQAHLREHLFLLIARRVIRGEWLEATGSREDTENSSWLLGSASLGSFLSHKVACCTEHVKGLFAICKSGLRHMYMICKTVPRHCAQLLLRRHEIGLGIDVRSQPLPLLPVPLPLPLPPLPLRLRRLLLYYYHYYHY